MSGTSLGSDQLATYLAVAIVRASRTFSARPPADPQHALALGEVVALFNLADEFGLIGAVRSQADQQLGRDAYAALSSAMKSYYLGSSTPARASDTSRHSGGRPRHGRPGHGQPPRAS
jgi:hypothetical protein